MNWFSRLRRRRSTEPDPTPIDSDDESNDELGTNELGDPEDQTPIPPTEGPQLSPAYLELRAQDDKPIGDPIECNKPEGTTRFYFQNIRSFNLSMQGTFQQTCEHIKSMGIDHAMFCEHALDTTKPQVFSQAHARARGSLGMGQYKLQMSSSPVEFHTTYKQGGTMDLSVGDLRSRMHWCHKPDKW